MATIEGLVEDRPIHIFDLLDRARVLAPEHNAIRV